MDQDIQARLRAIPSVDDLLQDDAIKSAAGGLSLSIVAGIAREEVAKLRASLLAGERCSAVDIKGAVVSELERLRRPAANIVVNGTGVIIHTNLGRSPVSRDTAAAMAAHAERYQALELRLATGERGGRGDEVSSLMRRLTGAERTLVVNNNAAAVLLTLAALTAGSEVVVSRGEAVEIGGGFRIPDVLRQSGATLVEVGTTNRTYLRDYADATTERTAAYLKVHASNFAITGFTATARLDDLARLASEHRVLLIEDVGSGCLLDTRQYGLAYEPTLTESIAAGVDVVCASGDKLLGGPQAGLIIGKADVVERIARHPLARALRADKTCLSGLAATLRHYIHGEAEQQIPVWWSISRELDWLESRVQSWKSAVDQSFLGVLQTSAVVGGGSLPGRTLPSAGLAIQPPGISAQELARRLRTGTPAVMPRIVDDVVVVDARTVLPDEDRFVIDEVRQAFA